jgi:hypothetical protein
MRLAIVSLRRHAPGLPILASCPGASAEFVSWVSEQTDLVQTDPEFGGLGWNVKPRLLLRAMELTGSPVLWLDADVIVNGDIDAVMPSDLSVLVAAEEFALAQEQGSEARTAAWALVPGRRLSSTANTSVLRVSEHHVGLLERWAELLERPDYRAAQELPARERPLHMLGDQDALTALLGSREYGAVALHLLRRGREIAQCGSPAGYLPSERIRGLWSPLPVRALGRRQTLAARRPMAPQRLARSPGPGQLRRCSHPLESVHDLGPGAERERRA